MNESDRGAASHDPRSVAAAASDTPRPDDVSLGIRQVLTVSAISSVAGSLIVVQDVVLAAHFGATAEADAYQLAMSVPTMALNVFGGGTVLAVLVPRLVSLEVSGRGADASKFLAWCRQAITWLLLSAIAAWAVVYPQVVGWVARDFPPATRELSVRLCWVALPLLLFGGLASIETAVLNSRGRFARVSALPAFMPLGVAIGILLMGRTLGIFAAAFGALAGSVVQWLSVCRATGGWLRLSGAVEVPSATSALVRTYAESAAAAALLAGVLVTDTWVASTLQIGSTATYGYGARPVVLLLALATTAVGNVALPRFSYSAAAEDFSALKRQFAGWCGLLVLSALPVVVVIHAFAGNIIALIYQRGTFTASDTANVAAVLASYVLQVPFYLVGMMGWRVMNSLDLNRPLLAIAAVVFAVNLAVDLALRRHLGLVGVAWGTNVAFAVWAGLIGGYLLLARTRHRRRMRSPA